MAILDGFQWVEKMGEMSDSITFPRSPKDEINGIPYFLRMCHKIRMYAAGELHEDYHANLGGGFDLWTCQFFGVEYNALVEKVNSGASDEEALTWAQENGVKRESYELDWWISYMTNRGYRDNLSEKLELRKQEAGLGHRDDITSFMGFIDAEEGHE